MGYMPIIGSAHVCPLLCMYRFWANPIVVIVANKAMALWMREKVANGVFQAMEFCSLAFYLVSPNCR